MRAIGLVVPIPPFMLQDSLFALQIDAVDAIGAEPLGLRSFDHPLELLYDTGALEVGGAGIVNKSWTGGLILWDRGPVERPQNNLLA